MEVSKYNYYDILEISQQCPQHEVTTAYERAKTTYSGENPAIYTIFSEHEARELLKLVEEAYAVLGNKTLRAIYDEKLSQKNVNLADLSYENLKALSKVSVPEAPKKISSEPVQKEKDPNFESEYLALTAWDGQWIKKVREYKGLSVGYMSEVTKISSFYITAVEEEQIENLPAPVFVRGYVVQIAKVLGLNEKLVADTYMKRFKDKFGK